MRATIAAELDRLEPDVQQLTLDLPELEGTQLRADVAALRARVEAIPGEITAEQRLIDARYADQHPLMFPAAVTILVPAAGVPDIAAAGAAAAAEAASGAAAAAAGAGAPEASAHAAEAGAP